MHNTKLNKLYVRVLAVGVEEHAAEDSQLPAHHDLLLNIHFICLFSSPSIFPVDTFTIYIIEVGSNNV